MQYQQLLASGQRISSEQFAYYDLMTAAGTNVPGALDAQRRQFEGNQRAHATVQSGYANDNAEIIMTIWTHRLAPLATSSLTVLVLGACSEPAFVPGQPAARLQPLAEITRQAPPSFVPEFAGEAAPGRPGKSPAASSARPGVRPAGPSHAANASGSLDRLIAWERQDFGVRPSRGLHQGESHRPSCRAGK